MLINPDELPVVVLPLLSRLVSTGDIESDLELCYFSSFICVCHEEPAQQNIDVQRLPFPEVLDHWDGS